jgi:hypothetical protein
MVCRCVVDTVVLQSANASLAHEPKAGRKRRGRLRLLRTISDGMLVVLYSQRLIAEYRARVREPRNDHIRAFFELLTSERAVPNWASLTGSEHDVALKKCRFPQEDLHVLRTAYCGDETTIFTEEARMLRTDRCIHREFSVHVREPGDAV